MTRSTTCRRGAVSRAHAAILACCLAFLFVPCRSALCEPDAGGDRPFDLGFLASRDTDLHGNSRFRMLGPLVEWQKAGDGKTFRAIRPLWNCVQDPVEDRRLTEVLWPVSMFKCYRGESFWRVICAFGHDFDTADPDSRRRFIVFPVLYAGVDINDEGYFGIFPIAGKVNEFLGRDRIWFLAFPLYMYSSIHDVETRDVLWPFISWTHGEGVSRHRFLPFFLRSSRAGQWTRTAVAWPFWTSVRSTDPRHPGGGFILFPLYGHAEMGKRETWWLVPPFFKYDRSPTDTTVYCPYPIFQYSSGKVDKLYIWPIWGRKSTGAQKYSFLLWPICTSETVDRTQYVQKSFKIVPLIYYQSRTAKAGSRENADVPRADGAVGDPAEIGPAAGAAAPPGAADIVTGRYFKLWPILSYRRENDEARFRMPALWPAKYTPSIEKNLAPFWTLYSRERVGATKEDELLWGLFRYRRSPDAVQKLSLFPLFSWKNTVQDGGGRGWSFLMGLVGYERQGWRKKVRLLYLPISFGEERPDGDPAEGNEIKETADR